MFSPVHGLEKPTSHGTEMSKLRHPDSAECIDPAVCSPFLHGSTHRLTAGSIQYYAALIGQWSPLLYFLTGESTESSLIEEFRNNLLEYAREGVKLLELSLQEDTCRYFIPLVTFCGLHLCDALAHWSLDREEKLVAVRLGCDLLSRNRPGFQICGPLLQMFRTTIDQYAGIDISEELDSNYGPRDQFTIDEILDASTRLSYTMPVAQIARWLDPEFHMQWADEWIKQMGKSRRRRSPANRSMRVEDVMN